MSSKSSKTKVRFAYAEELLVAKISIRLANELHAANLKPHQLAKRAGVTAKTVKAILAADGNPPIKLVARLFALLDSEINLWSAKLVRSDLFAPATKETVQ